MVLSAFSAVIMEVEEQEHQKPMQKEKQRQRQRLLGWMGKIRHNEHITPSNDVQRLATPSQTPARPPIGGRTSSKVCVGLPRPSTFRRQQDERRRTLEPVKPSVEERRASSIARQRALSAVPRPQASEHLRGERSASQSGYRPTTTFSLDHFLETGFFTNPSLDEQHQISPSLPPPPPPSSQLLQCVDLADDVASQASYDNNKTGDEETRIEVETKWILNLSLYFRDKSPREKFFVTYAETHQKWRRVTISCDYRNAEVDSLEADLQSMSYQREKSNRIYEELKGSLDNIQFYDTVTNLRLETKDDGLHVHVTEDVNEIVAYPPVKCIDHLQHIKRFKESELHVLEHISHFMYKVDVGGEMWIKKDISGPDQVDEFIQEIWALSSQVNAEYTIKLQGIVISEDGSSVKGLLIDCADQNVLVDIYNGNHGIIPQNYRERWAKNVVEMLMSNTGKRTVEKWDVEKLGSSSSNLPKQASKADSTVIETLADQISARFDSFFAKDDHTYTSPIYPDKSKSLVTITPNDGLVSTSEDKTYSRVAATHRLRRRGRGSRRNNAYWTNFNTNAHEDFFNGRDCLFAGRDGKVNRPAVINLDSGLKIPGGLIMSRRYAKDLGKEGEISQDYKDPGLRDVSGNITPTNGILRNQSFRISGTSVTFIRDMYVCETIDDIVDVMAGVDFICAQFNLLFGKVKNLAGTFATWFSTTKESKKEKEKREWNEREQDIKAIRREIARYQRQREALLRSQQASRETGRRVMEYRIEVNRSEIALLQIEEDALLRAQQASRGAASSC